jgi:hypothetical protein
MRQVSWRQRQMSQIERTYFPVRRPLPSGEYTNAATPSLHTAPKAPIFGSSASKVNGEYSTWFAMMGWTLCAHHSVSLLDSQMLMYLTLPALEILVNTSGELESERIPQLDKLCQRTNCVFHHMEVPLPRNFRACKCSIRAAVVSAATQRKCVQVR